MIEANSSITDRAHRAPALRVLLLAAALFSSGLVQSAAEWTREDGHSAATGGDEIVLWYFRRDHCPVCERAEEWLESVEFEHPGLVVRRIDVVRDEAGRTLFDHMLRDRGERATAVPAFVLEDQVWVGFSAHIAGQIADAVRFRLAGGPAPEQFGPGVLDLGPLGSIDLAGRSLFAATVLISFVDGFNPCSVWVLTVLLAMILSSRSRMRIAAVGLTFLAVTAAIYGLFIVGLFTTLVIAGHLGWIQVAIALLALAFGLINVKDYFIFKRGLSLTIPDRFKPSIYRGARVLRDDHPLPIALAITVAFAAGVALIELPCTAGFPVIWTSLLSGSDAGQADFFALLAVYLLIYLLVEIAIVAAVVVTLRPSRLQERQGRILKLIGGMIMIALALVLLIDPGRMQTFTGSLIVIGGALAAALLVHLVHRRLAWSGAG